MIERAIRPAAEARPRLQDNCDVRDRDAMALRDLAAIDGASGVAAGDMQISDSGLATVDSAL